MPENPELFDWFEFVDRSDEVSRVRSRITLRDLFAGMAMRGLISSDARTGHLAEIAKLHDVTQPSVIAKMSYDMADAMLSARGEA